MKFTSSFTKQPNSFPTTLTLDPLLFQLLYFQSNMQFSATLLSLLAATAFAAPISLESHVDAVTDMVSFGNTDIDTPPVAKRSNEDANKLDNPNFGHFIGCLFRSWPVPRVCDLRTESEELDEDKCGAATWEDEDGRSPFPVSVEVDVDEEMEAVSD
ncbi:unnamed protein product [Ambrosiozyma monospora]|uniref:Unnamed protein product n=1 Tax=Ambrosiozyma monospora TaxID=43982 RepID=A0ACB5T5U4_AMBMO|nr:unnamed protein product [Ambrosiozyma monospora]